MVNHLKFNPIFKPAIHQVFGKTLICRDMDTASQFSKSADMDCITPEGNKMSVLFDLPLSPSLVEGGGKGEEEGGKGEWEGGKGEWEGGKREWEGGKEEWEGGKGEWE